MKHERLSFESLSANEISYDHRLLEIYHKALGLWPDKTILFDLTYDRQGGGMRVYQHEIIVWLDLRSKDHAFVLAHELAHVINERESDTPPLDPKHPDKGDVRQVLSDLINIPEHQRVHEILSSFGFDVADEGRKKSEDFLKAIPSVPTDAAGNNLHFSVGYAMMLTVFRSEGLTDEIQRSIHALKPKIADLGEKLARYVRLERKTTLYKDAVELMKIANIDVGIRNYVMNAEQFAARFGWS